jgi:uncharacterized protein YjbI with pentapeptide repeats
VNPSSCAVSEYLHPTAQLRQASLVGAQLQEARLDGARLQGASLIGAQLEGAILDMPSSKGRASTTLTSRMRQLLTMRSS